MLRCKFYFRSLDGKCGGVREGGKVDGWLRWLGERVGGGLEMGKDGWEGRMEGGRGGGGGKEVLMGENGWRRRGIGVFVAVTLPTLFGRHDQIPF